MDKPLFFATIILCIIGLVMVFSSSSISAVLRYETSPYHFFTRQLLFMLVTFALGIGLIIKIPIKKYKKIYSLVLIGVVAMLGLLIVYGSIINGARSWFALGPITIQPSEFAKTATILYIGCFFDSHINSDVRFYYVRPLIASLVVVALVFIQPDLGTAAIIGLLIYMIFMVVPFDKNDKDIKMFKIVGTSLIGAVVLLMLFGGNLLNSEQADRLTYKNPCSRYIEKTGYQVCNGMIAMNKCLAQEVGSRGITVNSIAPGFIRTPMTDVLPEDVKAQLLSKIPEGKLGEAQDIANAVAFLASDEAQYITGQTIHVNGGMAMI